MDDCTHQVDMHNLAMFDLLLSNYNSLSVHIHFIIPIIQSLTYHKMCHWSHCCRCNCLLFDCMCQIHCMSVMYNVWQSSFIIQQQLSKWQNVHIAHSCWIIVGCTSTKWVSVMMEKQNRRQYLEQSDPAHPSSQLQVPSLLQLPWLLHVDARVQNLLHAPAG